MSFKIYTKTGDKGRTALIGGTKVPKSHIRIEAYGTVDELNSHVGLVADSIAHDGRTVGLLREVQDRLFTIGSLLACDPDKDIQMQLPGLEESDILLLETEIDTMDAILEPMKSFILPGGSIPVSYAHLARCVCRRAERCCVRMQEEGLEVDPLVVKYLNRLSDHLFVLARYIAHGSGTEEIKWKPRVEKTDRN